MTSMNESYGGPGSKRLNVIRAPSGDHDGWTSDVSGSLVRSTGSLPSAFITKMSYLLPTARSKAICDPSGDHAGSESSCPSSVSWVWPLPSAFIVQRCQLVPAERPYTMRVPSGDQLGAPSLLEGVLVRSVSPVPSRLTTQMSEYPPFGYQWENAIRVPSGDQLGPPFM
jgi:hypothetical protein